MSHALSALETGCRLDLTTVHASVAKKSRFSRSVRMHPNSWGSIAKKGRFSRSVRMHPNSSSQLNLTSFNSPLLPVQAGDTARHRGRGGTIAGGYNGGWAVEAAMDRTGAIRAP